jgi:exodeoxyribonuclease VII small subunit
VSKSTRTHQNASNPPADLPYEEALRRLESVVQQMEAGDLPLESLLARFEEGTKLAQLCQTRLAEAELKIQQLEPDPDGALTTRPLELPPEEQP